MIYTSLLSLVREIVVVECRGYERLLLLLVKRFFPLSCVRSFRCEFLGISSWPFRSDHRFVPLSPYCRRRRS